MMNKLKSRRFIAWLVWTVLMGFSIMKTGEVNQTLASWYGTITCLYIGSSVAKSYIFKDKGNE